MVEALALENNLIKQRMPRYNIRLRDDKNYPYLQLTTSEPCPRVLVARRVERDGNVYAGPFMPASLARRTMALAHRLFGIRSCNEEITGKRDRPCLEYDIGRCLAPCVDTVCPPEPYQEAVDRTRLLLDGRTAELVGAPARPRCARPPSEERFEQAAHLRDAIRTLQTLRDRQQKMATTRLGDRDAFGVKSGPSGSVIQVFQMRGGRVIERVELVAEAEHGQAERGPRTCCRRPSRSSTRTRDIPPEIHVPVALDEADAARRVAVGAGRPARRDPRAAAGRSAAA